MRTLLVFAALVPLCAQEDAREIVRKAIERDEAQRELARQYTFVQRIQKGNGESKTYDVLNIGGEFYERLIQKNDKPLSPREEEKERKKFEESVNKYKRETPEQRAKRLAKDEKERKEVRGQLRQILDAYHLSMAGEEQVSNRDAWVIDAKPRDGFKGKGRLASMFPKLQGKLWISKGDYQMVKAEVETLDTISFGWVLARMHKGTTFRFEQTRINDEIWLPKHITASISARVALFKKMQESFDITFRDYKKFQTDSRVVEVSDNISEK